MLGKLLKYEAKAGAKPLCAVYAGMAGVFLIGLLARELHVVQIQVTTAFLLIAGGVAAVVMAVVMAILRYHRGLFGAEGYLTQTLPVSKGKLILAKLTAAYAWTAVSILAAVLAAAGVMYLFRMNFAEIAGALIDLGMGTLLLVALPMFAIQLLAFFGELYFAITLANTRPFLRSNAAFSFVFYLAANFAVGLLELVGMLVIPLGLHIGETGVYLTAETMLGSLLEWTSFGVPARGFTIGIGSGVVDLAVGIGLLLAARWLLQHKTSVK